MPHVTVRVPASTSNLGPGFDCLGVALRLYNDITVEQKKGPPLQRMMRAAGDAFFKRARVRPFSFTCQVAGEVPLARGLGSSVTIRLGVIHSLNTLAASPLGREQIFRLCAELEGHPDNAAPATFGGFNLVRREMRQRFPVSAALKFVLLIPDFEVKTEAARASLPERISRVGAVESCGNAAAITAAFATQHYRSLRGALTDSLHTPFRKKFVPFFDDVVAAAEKAGALGAFLSGSGSTIAAVTLAGPEKVAAAMRTIVPAARVLVTTADNRGAHLFAHRASRPLFRVSR